MGWVTSVVVRVRMEQVKWDTNESEDDVHGGVDW
jgi:hypothetical protein